jgi:hypothetical protein
MLKPDYRGGKNIYSVAQGVANFLGVKRGNGKPLELSGRRLVLVLLDGLGWSTMTRSSFRPPAGASLEKFTTVFPSTTSTVLTTLFTAQTPGEHGVLGYTCFSKRVGSTVIPVKYTFSGLGERDTLKDLGPFESLFPGAKPYLGEASAKAVALLPRGIEGSGFNSAMLKGAEVRGYSGHWDAFQSLDYVLQIREYQFVYLYISDVDFLSHKHGPLSWAAISSASELLSLTAGLAERYKEYTFLVTADHGHVDSKKVNLNEDSELLNNLDVPPYGDSRALFLRTRQPVRAYLESRYPQLKVFQRDSFPELFGGVGPATDLPDYVAVPTDQSAFLFSPKLNDPEYQSLRGHHGGLMEDELEIPVIKFNA